MIVGRGIRYRIHGLQSLNEPIAMGIGPPLVDGGPPGLILEIAKEPQFNVPSISFPRFLVAGTALLPTKVGAEELDFEGEYLTVVAAASYDVPADLSARLESEPVDTAALDAVERLVGQRATDEQRSRALLAGGICAARLSPAVLEQCGDFQVFWPRPRRHVARHSSDVAEVLDASSRSADDLQELLQDVALAAQHAEFANPLRLATYWYVRGRAAAAGTIERFVGLFQSLEALTNCAPQGPTPEITDFLLAVAAAFNAVDDSGSARRLEMLSVIKQRLARPVLSERFERLVRLLKLEQPESLTKRFAALNKLRNDILHAHLTVLPGMYRGLNVDRTIVEMSAQLLNAMADHAIAEVRPRYRVWLEKSGSERNAGGTTPPAS